MIPVTQAVYDAIMEVRESGLVNMLDWRGVLAKLADRHVEAWLWVYDHKAAYLRAIRQGFDVDGQGDPRLNRMICGHERKHLVSSDEGTSFCAACEEEARGAHEGKGSA